MEVKKKRKQQPIIGNPKLDGRRKLSIEDKEAILKAYNNSTSWNHAEIARSYGVSDTTIKYLVNPKMLKENRQLLKDKGGHWKVYNSSEKNKTITAKYRAKKIEIMENLKKENIFKLLKTINEGVVIDNFHLKNGTILKGVHIVGNEGDKKILNTEAHGNIFYSDVKSFEITSVRRGRDKTPIATSYEVQYDIMLQSLGNTIKMIEPSIKELPKSFDERLDILKSLEKK
jgi:hypothetical protein